MPELPTYSATRYVQPLREGGSLPAVVDTEGGGLFVVKFRGAGQGAKALVAELIAGLLAESLGLPTPPLALIDVPPPFGRSEPDPEIQHILRGSHGLNVGARYLDGAFNFEPSAAGELIGEELAARIVWFDSLLVNPDRTHRNPNLLIWQRRPWLIDHGSSLYVHHDWDRADEARTRTPFPLVREHVLLRRAADIAAADAALAGSLTEEVIRDVLARVPDALLAAPPERAGALSPDESRERYLRYLRARLEPPRDFVAEAVRARQEILGQAPRPLSARR